MMKSIDLPQKIKETQLKMLYDDFEIPNFKINSFDLKSTYKKDPVLDEKLDLNLAKYASISGSRLFVPLNMASKWSYMPRKIDDREYDIHKNAEFVNIDTTKYTIPEGYRIEVLPEKEKTNTKYGTYSIECHSENNMIIYTRHLEVNSGVFPATEYDDFVEFFKQIHKTDNAMAILKRIE